MPHQIMVKPKSDMLIVHSPNSQTVAVSSLALPSSITTKIYAAVFVLHYNSEEDILRKLNMSEVVAGFLGPCQQNYFVCRVENFSNGKWQVKLKKPQLKWHANIKSNSQNYLVRNEFAVKPATYSARISTDIPLYETPRALFDEYLKDKPRIFNAMFPDKHRSKQLNQDEWRIQMLPLKLLVLTVWPVVDLRLRCKSRGRDYPPEVPRDITKVLELDITRWELQGLHYVVDPSHFTLIVKGTLYPDRRGNRSRLRGHLEMNISFVLPPALALVPENIRDSLGKGVMMKLVESMKQKVDGSLLADYSKFKRERSEKRV